MGGRKKTQSRWSLKCKDKSLAQPPLGRRKNISFWSLKSRDAHSIKLMREQISNDTP